MRCMSCFLIFGIALLADPSEAQSDDIDWAPVYNSGSCKTDSADWLGSVDKCSAKVCVTAKFGWKLKKPNVVEEDNQGVGSGCGGPYKAVEVEDEDGNSYTTKYCADMWAQSHGGPYGSPGRIQCGLHAFTAKIE